VVEAISAFRRSRRCKRLVIRQIGDFQRVIACHRRLFGIVIIDYENFVVNGSAQRTGTEPGANNNLVTSQGLQNKGAGVVGIFNFNFAVLGIGNIRLCVKADIAGNGIVVEVGQHATGGKVIGTGVVFVDIKAPDPATDVSTINQIYRAITIVVDQ